MTSFYIPDSVTEIGGNAFAYCRSLTSVNIPDSVQSIGIDAFSNCESITAFSVDVNNNFFSSDSDGVLYDKDKTILLYYPAGNPRTAFSIPDGVTNIRSTLSTSLY